MALVVQMLPSFHMNPPLGSVMWTSLSWPDTASRIGVWVTASIPRTAKLELIPFTVIWIGFTTGPLHEATAHRGRRGLGLGHAMPPFGRESMMGRSVGIRKSAAVRFTGPMPRYSRRAAMFAATPVMLLVVAWLAAACAPSPRPRTEPPAKPAPSVAAESAVAPKPVPPPPPAAPPAPDQCAVSRYTPPGRDTVRVVAPEAFANRQLFETLVRFDCAGQLRPALALTWHPENRGRVWVLTLRPGARYWDGARVTPADIAAAWAPDSAAGTPVRAAGILAVEPAGDRDIRLTLAAPRDSLPPALADPALAIVRTDPSHAVGTGRYRPGTADHPPRLLAPADSSAHEVIKLLTGPRDLRDLLDAGADLVVTDEPSTLT